MSVSGVACAEGSIMDSGITRFCTIKVTISGHIKHIDVVVGKKKLRFGVSSDDTVQAVKRTIARVCSGPEDSEDEFIETFFLKCGGVSLLDHQKACSQIYKYNRSRGVPEIHLMGRVVGGVGGGGNKIDISNFFDDEAEDEGDCCGEDDDDDGDDGDDGDDDDDDDGDDGDDILMMIRLRHS